MRQKRVFAIAAVALLVIGGLAIVLRNTMFAPSAISNVASGELAPGGTEGAVTAAERHGATNSGSGDAKAPSDKGTVEARTRAAGDPSRTDLLAVDPTTSTTAETPAAQDGGAIPRGWQLYSPTPAAYKLHSEHSVAWQGTASARIDVVDPQSAQQSFAGVMQTIRAGAYRAKRVRFSVFVRTQGADAATIAIGADDQNGTQITGKFMLVDVRREFPLRGDSGWTLLAMVIEIPDSAVALKFGAFLLGRGVVWADTARLEIVDATIPLTEMPPRRVPPHLSDPPWIEGLAEEPVNMDFEEVERAKR